MGELGSRYQDGRVGDPVIKMGELGFSYQDGSVGDPILLINRFHSEVNGIVNGIIK
jgi:hypothetical protein